MAYKLLGYVVWRGGKWYIRRRFGGARRKLALAAVLTAVVAGLVAAQRLPNRD
jgi:hypothetical protein